MKERAETNPQSQGTRKGCKRTPGRGAGECGKGAGSMTTLSRGNQEEGDRTSSAQMIQSSNTESENLEGDFTETLENTSLLGWNESKKSIKCWVEKAEEESS